MSSTPFKDRKLAGIGRDIIAALIPGEPGDGLGAGDVSGIVKMEARVYYLLDPPRRLSGYQQGFSGGAFQVDIVHKCEPAVSEMAPNRIEQGFELNVHRRLPTFCLESGDFAQADGTLS